jgi:DNA-binding MarR family transcriptional regulator
MCPLICRWRAHDTLLDYHPCMLRLGSNYEKDANVTGEQVSRLIERGFLRRDSRDGRSYALYITPRGEQMLAKLRERVPPHEKQVGVRLTLAERKQLRALLDKFVYG